MRKKRVAKYRRVSTKEQSIHGFSLQAQTEQLDKYAEEHNFVIVGDYVDEGISASNLQRPALQELLDDVRAGKIDLIIFTKLDRWFRSVSHYYKIQEILEKHNVPWRTVLEDYNTETSDGKFKVNIMLSVAQQELDRTSERIKVVFESKIKNKQVINGSLPIGYKIGIVNGQKQVVKDESKEELVLDFFTHFEIHQSLRATMRFINDKYDLPINYDSCKRMLKNTLYMGKYRDVKDYCEPYLTEEKFNKIQRIFKDKKQVKKYKHTYLFTGLISCPICGKSTSGSLLKSGNRAKTYYYYRCNRASSQLKCTNKSRIAEQPIEMYLLEHIEEELQNHIFQSEIEQVSKPKPKYDKSKIKAEIDRLNKMYQKGRIEDDEYDEEYDRLQAKLDLCNEHLPERDLRPLKAFLESDFRTMYDTLKREEKRSLWRSIIKRIVVHDNDNIDIEFL